MAKVLSLDEMLTGLKAGIEKNPSGEVDTFMLGRLGKFFASEFGGECTFSESQGDKFHPGYGPNCSFDWNASVPTDGGIYATVDLEETIEGWHASSLGGGFKSPESFKSGNGPCYVPDEMDRVYTRQNFLDLAGGNIALAERIFNLCEWQHAETILDELQVNEGVLTTQKAALATDWDF